VTPAAASLPLVAKGLALLAHIAGSTLVAVMTRKPVIALTHAVGSAFAVAIATIHRIALNFTGLTEMSRFTTTARLSCKPREARTLSIWPAAALAIAVDQGIACHFAFSALEALLTGGTSVTRKLVIAHACAVAVTYAVSRTIAVRAALDITVLTIHAAGARVTIFSLKVSKTLADSISRAPAVAVAVCLRIARVNTVVSKEIVGTYVAIFAFEALDARTGAIA